MHTRNVSFNQNTMTFKSKKVLRRNYELIETKNDKAGKNLKHYLVQFLTYRYETLMP